MGTAAAIVMTVVALGWPTDSMAQLKGHYIPGFTGLGNGSQAPPSISVIAPFYFYTTDELKDGEGNTVEFENDPEVDMSYIGVGLMWVTNFKIMGGNLGGSVIPLNYIKARLESADLDVSGEYDFTDMLVTPVQLGWNTPRADYLAAYGVFIPVGEWELGGDDNTGLGMWSHLFQAGTTLRLDDQRAWSLSTLASYEFHSDKKDTEIKVGNILTLEGGLSRSWYKIEMVGETPVPKRIISFGPVYYAQFKVTDDDVPLVDTLFDEQDQVFGVGLEGNVLFASTGTLLGLRILPEFSAQTRTEGLAITLTLAQGVKSLAR
jgi:hypothetical protein